MYILTVITDIVGLYFAKSLTKKYNHISGPVMKIARKNTKRQPHIFTTLLALWLLAVTTFLSSTAQAAESIWVFEDPTGERTYDEVMANPQWFERTSDTSRGFSDSVFWIKETLINPFATPMTQVVQFDSLRLPLVEEYTRVESGTRLRSNGYLISLAARPSSEHLTSFPVLVAPSSTTEVVYRIDSQFKVDLGYQVLDLNAASKRGSQTLLIGAMISSALLVLVIYNLILGLLNRRLVYLLYSGFLACSSLVSIACFRLYETLGFVLDSVYLEAYPGVALYAFAYLFLSQLFKAHQTKTTQRLLMLGYLVLGGHLLLEPYALIKSYADWAGPIVFFVFTYLVINAWLQKNPLAKFVMLGWSVYVLCSLLYVANLKGLLGPQFEFVVAVGNLFEGLVLSGALAYQLRLADKTADLLKEAEVELQRERLASEIGYGYKWEFDLERQLIRPDETFAAWHGLGWQAGEWYPAEELFAAIPQEWHAWVAEDMRKSIDSAMVDPEYLLQIRHPLIREDIGATIWIQLYGKILEVDGRKLLIGTSLDVTELVENKQSVEAEIEKFEGLAQQANILFWRLDLATRKMSYNRTFAKRWGLVEGESIDFDGIAEFMTPKFVQIVRESVDQVIATQKPVERVVQALAGQIQGQWHRMQYWPVFDSQGELIGVDFSNSNINTLMQTQAQLQDTLNRQKELFAIVGHELRTPVSTIKMLTEDGSQAAPDTIRQIGDISESLLQVLEDMRVVITPERALEAKPVVESPTDVIKRSLVSVQGLVNERGLNLDTQALQNSTGRYTIHAQALRQIVTNLVKNAAVHSGGSLIAVGYETSYSSNGNCSARLRVEDNGRGIDKASIANLFEAFERGDTRQDGSGLGLYIVKQLAQRLEGGIGYSKSVLGGACFTLTFPLGMEVGAAKEATDASSQTEAAPVSLDGMRILLAEDDNTLRMLTQRMLTNKGAKVVACVNGKAAFEAFKAGSFDLVVTDLMMPEMDGHELTRAIRAEGSSTAIVAVTAAVIGEETEQFYEEGANAVLSKPLRPSALVDALEAIESAGA